MFSISLIVCKYSYAEFAWLKRITLCFDSCDSTKGIKWHNDQLRQLGTLAGMVGSMKGSLKFSLEHSLTYVYVLNNIVIESKLIESKVTDR